MIGKFFTYNNISSEQYGLRFLSLETSEDNQIGGVIEYTNYKNNKSPYNTIQEINYNSTFEYELEMISETILDDKINEIYNWLLYQTNYKKLFISGDTDYYYNCIFTNASYIKKLGSYGYGIYGIKATMLCDSMFMWKDEKYTYTNSQLINTVKHNANTDVREYTYPALVIKTGAVGGNITLQNITEGRLTTIKSTLPNDTISLTSFPYTISSYLNTNSTLMYENFNKNFFRMLQGNNSIGIVGDIKEITLTYKSGRLVR